MSAETPRPSARYVAVIGPSAAAVELCDVAEEVGRRLAEQATVVVCGGLAGVMEAVARGASRAGGTVVGLLPGADRSQANPFLTVAVSTGLGELRNALVVRAADAVIALGKGYGTLSEIAFALRTGKPVIGLDTWPIEGITIAPDPASAVKAALGAIAPR